MAVLGRYRTVALPEALCAALERHPDATFTTDFSCELCGLEIPHRAGIRVPLLETCPLCAGRVAWAGFQRRRYRQDWERVS